MNTTTSFVCVAGLLAVFFFHHADAAEGGITTLFRTDSSFESVYDNIEIANADKPVPMNIRIIADWRYPAYVNSKTAELLIGRKSRDSARIELQVEFKLRNGNHVPCKPMQISLPENKRYVSLRVHIQNWPDGVYQTRIIDQEDDGNHLIRFLRKQTIPEAEPPEEPVDVTGITMLFVDDWHIDKRSKVLKRRLHPAETFAVTRGRLKDGHIIQRVQRLGFESSGSAVVDFYTKGSEPNQIRHYRAHSRDLKNWNIKPVKHGMKPHAKCVVSSSATKPLHWIDPRGHKGTYRAYRPKSDGPVDLSKVHVQFTGTNREPDPWGRIKTTRRSTYPVWRKSTKEMVVLTSQSLTRDKHLFAPNEAGEWQDTNDNWGGHWLSHNRTLLHFCQARLIPRHAPFRVTYDNILGSRLLVVWSTRNGTKWTPTFFTVPTHGDAVGLQFYGARGFWAENDRLRLAYLMVYDQVRQQIALELAYSRNSLLWHRFPKQPRFVDNGPFGAWNFGMIQCSNAPDLVYGNHVYNLVVGMNRSHLLFAHGLRPHLSAEFLKKRLQHRKLQNWPYWKKLGSWESLANHLKTGSLTIGIMRSRKDGWVSLQAGSKSGTLTTRTLRAGNALSVNARVQKDGFLQVEVLDEKHQALTSYSGPNAATIRGDSIDHAVRWANGTITILPERPIRLRIRMKKAELFGLRFHSK